MQKFASLSDAIALAEFAHRNQLDKAGLPYIDHPKRVLAKVQAMGGLPYVQIGAILHDVTEDTKFTPQMLLDLGFSEAAVDIVKLVDRGHSAGMYNTVQHVQLLDNLGKRMDVDAFYYHRIAKNPGAKMVKLADIEDNLSPWRLSYLSDETQQRLQVKYARAKRLLDTA